MRGLIVMWLCLALAVPVQAAGKGPAQVKIVQEHGAYRLLVDGQPFFIKGGGGSGQLEALAARGGNAVRTWRVESDPARMRAFLDEAQRLGLKVAVGIEVGNERHGFDYDDAAAVAAQLQRIREQVAAWKDHPAVLMWVAGNELNLDYRNQKVWNAIGGIADMIHQVDPNHPVMTTLAGFDRGLIDQLKQRAASLDLIGIQLYGNLGELPDKLKDSDWTGPYVVTEWGPTGHWESPLTAWKAPIEDDATRKAGVLLERYQRYIAGEHRQGLGSFVFLWGQKQERTPTWYGLFLADGESTPSVDAMQFAWTGRWPENRAPSISPIRVDDVLAANSVTLAPGSTHRAHVRASDRDGDALDYAWTLRAESTATSIGGDPEHLPEEIPGAVRPAAQGEIELVAPELPGNYRLFVEVRDGKGHAAYANFPLRVE